MATICRHFVAKAETATLIIFVGRPLQSEISASLRETFTTTCLLFCYHVQGQISSQRCGYKKAGSTLSTYGLPVFRDLDS